MIGRESRVEEETTQKNSHIEKTSGILSMRAEKQRQHGKMRVSVNGVLLAQFLEEIAAEEQVLLQRDPALTTCSISAI